ncbi:MAG: type II toxin-antitoxin system VapC family toxin [Candidatus Binatia bacterium]
MKPVFVDTGGWMALADASDLDHAPTKAFRDRWLRDGGRFVTTDSILDETLTLIRVRLGLDSAERWWGQVEESSRISWEWIDPARAEKARHWFFRWRDKDFSFTDCTSFVVMRERRLRETLTTDDHFRQAGFRVVPSG